MMNKEDYKKFWDYLIFKRGIVYETPELMDIVIEDFLSSSSHNKNPKVRINKQAKEVCIHPICMNPQYKEQLCRKHFIKLKTAQTG